MIDEIAAPLVLVEDKDSYAAEIVARDPRRDIALLRICCGTFTSVDFADSDGSHAGDEVVVIGYGENNIMPLTFRPGRLIVPGEASVKRGIVSAFRYQTWRDTQLVQHDAPLNGGDSGSPLFSRAGRVLGINTWRFDDDYEREVSREGLHFGVLETTVQERLRLWDADPSDEFGPLAGRLTHDAEDGYVEGSGLTSPPTRTSLRCRRRSSTHTQPTRANGTMASASAIRAKPVKPLSRSWLHRTRSGGSR